jgi:1-acyl-sn-glycerol-3-phosphate acyltransferase
MVDEHPAESIPDAPTAEDVATVKRMIGPLQKLINPKIYGIENVPQRHALLVGNHTTLGGLDIPLICAELWERGAMVRALGDNAHFKIPGFRDALLSFGVVPGTRANTSELMQRGELVLVFPGGGREVAKRKGEQYKLIWKNRMGFARLAIQHGYPIIPFASVGVEHGMDIILDADSKLLSPVAKLVKTVLGYSDTSPIVRGIGPTPIPRPERQYYWFGEPIDTTPYAGRQEEDAAAHAVRDQAAAAIEGGIEFLLAERENDPNRSIVKRLLGPERR